MRLRFTPTPKLVVVEPERAACLLASAKAGVVSAVSGDLATIMAGLACGEPSLLAWQELERAAWAFISIPDDPAVMTLQRLAVDGITIGESGVAGLAGLLVAASEPSSRTELCLTSESRVLLFGTEGITDAVEYNKVLHARQG
jgi:diaminopropionate ammonia-lyase